MKKLQLLSTVTASLLLAAGAASAQNLSGSTSSGGAGTAPAAQKHAPAEKVAPPMHTGRTKTSETTGQASTEQKTRIGRDHDKFSSDHKGSAGTAQMKSSAQSGAKTSGQASKGGKSATTQMKASKDKSATTGQGASAGAGKLSTEQRTKITTIFKHKKVKPARLNISVHIGARVPSHVHFHRLPREVVTIYPEWRGYDYILVGDQILVVNPHTHLIVAILEA